MPLTLSFSAGHDFFVGEENFLVNEVTDEHVVVLDSEDVPYYITTTRATELRPDVWVSVGKPTHFNYGVQLVFRAPRSIRIVRGALYDAEE